METVLSSLKAAIVLSLPIESSKSLMRVEVLTLALFFLSMQAVPNTTNSKIKILNLDFNSYIKIAFRLNEFNY